MKLTDNNYLLDTSIQIKRLISQKWRISEHDKTWEKITPVTSIYSFMEFKNSVIAALRYLADVLNEIASTKATGDVVKIRLKEVITYLNIDSTIRERDRRVRLASAYAAKLLEENNNYSRTRSVEEVLYQLTWEAKNLEEIGFFYYSLNKEPKKMTVADRVECHLGRNESPFTNGRSAYTCHKGEYQCKITQFVLESDVKEIIGAISDKVITIHDLRLREGARRVNEAINSDKLKTDTSIGQRMCQPIGDCIIVSKAHLLGWGLFTVDKDQVMIANYLRVPVLLYDAKKDSIM